MKTTVKNEPIVIYQMGKVACSSIRDSLISANYTNVHHVHYIKEKKKEAKEAKRIISIVRDTIARNISAFFQNLSTFHKKDTYDTKELINCFFNSYAHNVPLTWYDNEFFNHTKIDIFELPFDKENDYTIIKKNGFEILLMKIEISDNKKEANISEFLGNKIQLISTNVGKEKDYSDHYSLFKKEIKIPKEYADKLYNSKYMHYFYTKEEIASFIRNGTNE